MAILAVIFAAVALYCLWVVRRDEAEIRGMLDTAARARRANIILWHKRTAILSIVGMGIALGALIAA